MMLFIVFLAIPLHVSAYEGNNTFKTNIFPYTVSNRMFSLPLDSKKTAVIVPNSLKPKSSEMASMLEGKCGSRIPLLFADDIEPDDIRFLHLVILGNITNNRYTLELYNKRQAFADAYFPGKEGVIIHPATSVWNFENNVIVIGVSRDDDLLMGFETFVGLLGDGAQSVKTMHHLKTSLAFPKPPDTVDATLEAVRTRFDVFPAWSNIPFWGLCYFLSGDTVWADYFIRGCRALHDRAEKSGKWIPEPWTTIYYEFWRYIRVWRLLDDDPYFSKADRRIIENLLWAYTLFLDSDENYPYYTPENITEGIRQNHTNFHALSLFYSHHYFREKYGKTELDRLAEKYEPIFDGQATSYRSNDDAGYGYMYYTPHQTLLYQFMRGEDSYIKSKLKTLADLAVTVIDNRRDAVSFGDFSTYRHRTKGARRWLEISYPSMAAWYFGDGQYQWFYNWMTHDAVFTYDNMYYGDYAVDIPEELPERFNGIFPVLLDEGALKWAAGRTEKNTHLPQQGSRYVDKMSMRRSFDAQDEYLLMDGTSIFAHGHQDGNTVSRLTWKDRIWLFEMDYIKHTPKYHNGVIVARDGVQNAPPPLTSLNIAADFDDAGITRTQSTDYNGADWERNIVWRKGSYFLFLDRIIAREDGEYRLECRWRTRGDVQLDDNRLSAAQGDKRFYISSADDARKNLIAEPDTYLSNWNYPYGNGIMSIFHARKDISLSKGGDWTFAALMHAVDDNGSPRHELREAGKVLYEISGETTSDIIGMNPESLSGVGIDTDCELFLLDAVTLKLMNTSRVSFAGVSVYADSRVHIEFNYCNNTGNLVIPGTETASVELSGARFSGSVGTGRNRYTVQPGIHEFSFDGIEWASPDPIAELSKHAHTVHAPRTKSAAADFGITIDKSFDIPDTVSTFCGEDDAVLCADKKGRVFRIDSCKQNELFQVPSHKKVTAIQTADLDGNGNADILVGDAADSLYAYSGVGEQLWSNKMTRLFGINANAVDIAVGDAKNPDEPNIFVATMGFNMFGFDSKGNKKWETLIRYHPQTKAGYLRNGNNCYVTAGTIYSTPLNVVSPADGSMLWYTWEQVGDETKSVTDYCGIDLTDMVFFDTDGDGVREIVFGTRYNNVYALNAADGATKWKTNVGGEVTAMEMYENRTTGKTRLLAGTDAGDLFLLDHQGNRLRTVSLDNEITDIETITNPERTRVDFIVSTDEGQVTVLDEQFVVQASHTFENMRLNGLILGGKAGRTYRFYAVSDTRVFLMEYLMDAVSKSRFH